jgi:hypothetical protein
MFFINRRRKFFIRFNNIYTMVRDALPFFFRYFCRPYIHPFIHLHRVGGYYLALYLFCKGNGRRCFPAGGGAGNHY